MGSTYTPNKNLEKPAHNDYVDDWDVPVNGNSNAMDSALGGTSYINLTGIASYTLSYTDLQARTICFTGTLNNSTVSVSLTNGVSFEGNIVNATIAGGTSSLLTLGWTGAGNSYAVDQGMSQHMFADGLNPSITGWQPAGLAVPNGAAAGSFGSYSGCGSATAAFNVTGVASGGVVVLTAAQARATLLIFTGTVANGIVTYSLPAGVPGAWDIYFSGSVAGGSSLLNINVLGIGFGIIITQAAGTYALRVVTDGAHTLVKTT